MNVQLYTLLDRKTGSYSNPFVFQHEAIMTRSMSEMVNDPSTSFHKYHADYDVYWLASFDAASGLIIPGERTFLANLSSFKEQGE